MTDLPSAISLNTATDIIPGMARHWDFVLTLVQRLRIPQAAETVVRNSAPRPDWQAILPLTPVPAWTVYFLLAPKGGFTPTHCCACWLRDAWHRLMLLCATPLVADAPIEINAFADALYWKALPGYDFLAYSIALHEISCRSRPADVPVINNSLCGAFADVRSILERAPWELTRVTATSQVENRIRSYAFVPKDVTPARMFGLPTVMFSSRALSNPHDVIQVQETSCTHGSNIDASRRLLVCRKRADARSGAVSTRRTDCRRLSILEAFADWKTSSSERYSTDSRAVLSRRHPVPGST